MGAAILSVAMATARIGISLQIIKYQAIKTYTILLDYQLIVPKY